MHRIHGTTTGRWLLGILLILPLLIGACGASDDEDSPGSDSTPTTAATTASPTPAPSEPTITPTEPEVDVDATRAEPDVGMADREALVEGLNRFAIDLYLAAGAENDDNLIFSPTSISLAFSMVYAGARGETGAQMADTLGFLPQDTQHPAANALDQYLASLGSEGLAPGAEEGEPFQLNIANAIWGQQGFPFMEEFLETLATHYGAELQTADFVTQAEAARQEINAWVAERTEGRIEEAVPKDVLNEMTRLVLANAIYFKAGWLRPFDEDATTDGSFTLLDGSDVTVPMMAQAGVSMPYVDANGYQAAILPYVGRDVGMVVILPDAGSFAEFEAGLSPDLLTEIRQSTETHSVELTMPKFDFETRLALHEILPEMGMPAPFEAGIADLSGIATDSDLYISAALHQANITVDEKGTEAAAVTVIGVEATGAPMPAELRLDRPFLFAITERESGAVLFMGRVTNPSS